MKNDSWRIALASAFGLGLSPVAPGTCGALLGVGIHISVSLAAPSPFRMPLLLVCFLAVCIGNHLLTPWAQAYWRHKDPKHFVLDEVAGYLLVPILFHQGQLWQVALWGFLGFRALDMIKVPPAWQIDKKGTGAWAILMDDIVAAIYAVCGLHVLRWIGPYLGIERWLIS
jgi:phosphatidylglycerophosphatase A